MTSPVIYIAAKPPVPGLVKTRLAQGVGDGLAVSLYRAFLEDIAAEVRRVGTDLAWFIPREPSWQPPSLGWRQVATRWQTGLTWSGRQANLFTDCHHAGSPATVLIASDSPQLTAADIDRALVELREADVVVGPVADGGYYLLGMRGGHGVVEGIEMSTRTVCDQVIGRAHGLGLRVRVLSTLFDVDDVGDLDRLAPVAARLPHLACTRLALEQITLARRLVTTS